MIQSKDDYRNYYFQDLRNTGLENGSMFDRIRDRRYRFYKSLRVTEYYTNCRKDLVGRVAAKFFRARHSRLCDKYQWTIPINVFGAGLSIVHSGTIVVSGKARIGENCRIHVCVNIGNALVRGQDGTPVIGDNVYIGPGAKIFGPIVIGDNVAIGANAVVNSSFPNGNCTIAGVPAKVISNNTSAPYMRVL